MVIYPSAHVPLFWLKTTSDIVMWYGYGTVTEHTEYGDVCNSDDDSQHFEWCLEKIIHKRQTRYYHTTTTLHYTDYTNKSCKYIRQFCLIRWHLLATETTKRSKSEDEAEKMQLKGLSRKKHKAKQRRIGKNLPEIRYIWSIKRFFIILSYTKKKKTTRLIDICLLFLCACKILYNFMHSILFQCYRLLLFVVAGNNLIIVGNIYRGTHSHRHTRGHKHTCIKFTLHEL